MDFFFKRMYNTSLELIPRRKGGAIVSAENELKIAIVDDLENDRVQIQAMANRVLQDADIPHNISCYKDGAALLNDLRDGRNYHLLLLDVLMDEMNGITLAGQLRAQGNETMIVFISSCQEMARQGYKVRAMRYLAKPLEQEEVAEALLACHEEWQAKKEILLPTDHGQYRISIPDIQYVEAFDRGTRFVLRSEMVETRMKLSQVERMLPKSTFVQCHRAYIVNMAHTRRISQYEFLMKSGSTVPISRLRYPDVHRLFVRFFVA